MKFVFVIFGALVAATVLALAKQSPLRTFDEVKLLTHEQAALHPPVLVEATILKAYPNQKAAFVHDGKWGIHLSFSQFNRKGESDFEQGDLLEIEGYAKPGNFFPYLVAKKVTRLGVSPLPDPLIMTPELHMDPTIDCAWVQLNGTIIESAPTGDIIALRVNCYNNTVISNIILGRTPETEAACKKMIHQRISAQLVAVTRSNSNGQMERRYFQANSLKDIQIVGGSREIPLVPISQLMQTGTMSQQIARIRGIVTHVSGRELYLQDENHAVLVSTREEHSWERGQSLEVSGVVMARPFAPSLLAQNIKAITSDSLVEKLIISVSERPLPTEWHHRLVGLEATLMDIRQSDLSTTLSCEADGHFFEAVFETKQAPANLPKLGSRLGLTGICALTSSQPFSLSSKADGLSLILRSKKDVEVLKRPPFWTLRKFLILVGLLAVITAVALGWAALLRSRVKKQTAIIGSQIEREVSERERHRLARELHDTFEQNMGSLALQLSSARRYRDLGNGERLERSLTLAQKTLSHCQRESRESIYDLRRDSGSLASGEWHDELLINESEVHGTKIETSVSGVPFECDQRTEHHLVKIIREAALNAIRHGQATKVLIKHEFGDDQLTLSIIDDGRGFTPTGKRPRGHFGIIGMKERAKRAAGELRIDSQPGVGTTITVTIPKPRVTSPQKK